MPENKVNIELTGSESKFLASLNRGLTGIRSYSGKAIEAFSRVNKAIMNSYSKLGMLGNLGIGFGVYEMGKDLIEFDGVLRKIGRTSGASTAEMIGLRQQIMGLISPGSGIPLTKGEFADMAEAMRDAGMSVKEISALLPQVGKGAVASQTGVKEYGKAIGELINKYHVAAADLPALQDQLNQAMKFEGVSEHPEEFLESIGHLAKGMQLIHAEGMTNLTPLLALQLQLTHFAGNSGEATTSIDAMLNGLLKLSGPKGRQIRAVLRDWGVELFNAKGGLKNFSKLIPEFKKLAEIGARKGFSLEEVSLGVFGKPEAAKALMMIVQEYDEIMKKRKELEYSTGSMGRDFNSEAESMASKLKLFQNQLDQFEVDHMTGALKKLSGILDFLEVHPAVTTGILSTIGLMAVTAGLNKVWGVFKGIYSTVTMIGALPIIQAIGAIGGIAGGIVGLEAIGAVGYQQSSSAEARGLLNWRTNNPYDYARSQQLMGGQMPPTIYPYDYARSQQLMGGQMTPIQNTIHLSVHISPDMIRTDVDDLNTNLKVHRGTFIPLAINH